MGKTRDQLAKEYRIAFARSGGLALAAQRTPAERRAASLHALAARWAKPRKPRTKKSVTSG